MPSINRYNIIQLLLLITFIIFLAACSTPISTYQHTKPELIIEQFFNGQLTAHGVVKNFKGEVIRHFNADIAAHWVDRVGTLDEDFVFDNGEKQKRIWTIRPIHTDTQSPGEKKQYIGTAGDVIGESLIEVSGNAMFLNYVLQIPYKDGTMNIKIDDRMYLVNPTTIINESKLYKFGLPVGNITLTIIKK